MDWALCLAVIAFTKEASNRHIHRRGRKSDEIFLPIKL